MENWKISSKPQVEGPFYVHESSTFVEIYGELLLNLIRRQIALSEIDTKKEESQEYGKILIIIQPMGYEQRRLHYDKQYRLLSRNEKKTTLNKDLYYAFLDYVLTQNEDASSQQKLKELLQMMKQLLSPTANHDQLSCLYNAQQSPIKVKVESYMPSTELAKWTPPNISSNLHEIQESRLENQCISLIKEIEELDTFKSKIKLAIRTNQPKIRSDDLRKLSKLISHKQQVIERTYFSKQEKILLIKRMKDARTEKKVNEKFINIPETPRSKLLKPAHYKRPASPPPPSPQTLSLIHI